MELYHTFLAGWCADAAGARLEFSHRLFTEQEAVDAMHFTGMKTTSINEGQFTDDSEMELALLNALYTHRHDPYFPIEHIAEAYLQWYQSNPFDIGQTITLACCDASNADDMATNAYLYNEDSESNGSMMRSLPLAVFSLHKSFEAILDMVEMEVSLTHYSPVVKLTTGIYCCLLSHILSSHLQHTPLNSSWRATLQHDIGMLCKRHEVVQQWHEEGTQLTNLTAYDATGPQCGHVKHAFVMVIHCLTHLSEYTYEHAIQSVLQCGGDTDTNAKIVGNVVGAYHATSCCVPPYMLNSVSRCDSSRSLDPFYKRPSQYTFQSGQTLVLDTIRHLTST